jgi:hypothetical protein
MNKNYNFIFLQSADTWESVTPNTVETMFERAENMGYRLKSFKEWLLKQPLTNYTKSRIEGIYKNFCEGDD